MITNSFMGLPVKEEQNPAYSLLRPRNFMLWFGAILLGPMILNRKYARIRGLSFLRVNLIFRLDLNGYSLADVN